MGETKHTKYMSSTDGEFLDTIETWLRARAEIFVMLRFSRAAGAKSYEFFPTFNAFSTRLRQLPPQTCITAFRNPQLAIRGIVDEEFIIRCLGSIPDGSEFLVVETIPTSQGRASWFHDTAGESHSELRGALESSRGKPVAVGEYPPWQENSPDVVSAVVPDESGVATPGIY